MINHLWPELPVSKMNFYGSKDVRAIKVRLCIALLFNGVNILSGEVLFVLRFYGPVIPVGSCRARSVYLHVTTRLLGRFSPLSG